MLYYLFRFLDQFNVPGSHMWQYISFRALLTLILSLVISAWFGERFIKYMKRKKISETQRDVSIDPFGTEKKGVPTMGGIIIIVAILIPVILLGRMRNIYLLLMIATTVWLPQEQGRTERKVQDCGTSKYRTYRGTDALGQPRC